jgi:hypothetical protein
VSGVVISASGHEETRSRLANAAGQHVIRRPPRWALGRSELKRFRDWNDDRPGDRTRLQIDRQATNKIVGISDKAAAFLRGFF